MNANDAKTQTIQLGLSRLRQSGSLEPTIRLIPQVITLDQFASARGLERLQESEVSGVPAAAEDRERERPLRFSLADRGQRRGACTI